MNFIAGKETLLHIYGVLFQALNEETERLRTKTTKYSFPLQCLAFLLLQTCGIKSTENLDEKLSNIFLLNREADFQLPEETATYKKTKESKK